MFKNFNFKNFNKKQRFTALFFLLVLIGGLCFLGLHFRDNTSAIVTANFSNSTLQGRMSQLEKEVQGLKESLVQKENPEESKIISEEEQRIQVVQEVLPSVVSIIASKKVAVYSSWFGAGFSLDDPLTTEQEQEVGSGTGFFVSKDGLILTNKHVVSDEEAKYMIITDDNQEYSAEVLARDPLQDLALIKIEGSDFPAVKLGDSSEVILAQSIICIGNALGEFQNTVSAGVVSGLGRHISATGGGVIEALSDVIQTDAAINPGNSGGPLVNLQGEVIGINVAMATSAENIGFAIPINQAKNSIEQVEETGKIVYPFLGVRYVAIDKAIQEKYTLSVGAGALIIRGQNQEEVAVEPGSTAEKMGLQESDIILKLDDQLIDEDHVLGDLIREYHPGDKITLEVLRQDDHLQLSGILGKRES